MRVTVIVNGKCPMHKTSAGGRVDSEGPAADLSHVISREAPPMIRM